MSETVQFWLDNKMSAGIRVAAIGNQALVVYREKYYVVEKDAAQSRGGKALRYSRSSLPTIWKRALKGETPAEEGLVVPPDEALPMATTTKRERAKKASTQPPAPDQPVIQAPVAPVAPQPAKAAPSPRIPQKMTIKPAAQTTVSANCPECNFRHEFPLEKGRSGKPFFTACTRCKAEFAVRFVPAMIFQAQVAGFR